MQNSKQIKQAPDPTGGNRSRQIFQSFTDATIALLESPDTPEELRSAISEAITDAGNQIGIPDNAEVARRTLSWMLGLNGAGQTEEAAEATASSNDCDDDKDAATAAEELAKAFATIEEYSDYIPEKYYKDIADGIHDWSMDAQWICDPQLMRVVLPSLLRKVIKNAEEEAA